LISNTYLLSKQHPYILEDIFKKRVIMSKTLTVGTEDFEFPIEGENPGYATEVTDWAEAVSDALATVQRPNDVLLTTSSVSNSAITPTNIPGFSFSTAEVKAIDCRYVVTRTTTGPSLRVTEVGYIEGYFDGTEWGITIRTTGDASIFLSITPAGQLQYYVTPLAGATHVGTIKFEGRVINNV
jgi:hypothetical protein